MGNALDTSRSSSVSLGAAAALSIGAGFVHAAVIGHHAEHEQLALLFVAAAVFQVGWGIVALWRPSRPLAVIGALGNAAAFGAWLASRLTALSFIDGLEHKEAVDVTDTLCAVLGIAAAVAAVMSLTPRLVPARALALAPAALLATAFAVPAVVVAATDAHSHSAGGGHEHGAGGGHEHAGGGDGHEHTDGGDGHDDGGDADHAHDGTNGDHEHDAESVGHAHATSTDSGHGSHAGDDHGSASGHGHGPAAWPRAWNPSAPIDVSGVEGVTPQQERFAVALIADTMRDLPRYADPATAYAEGYRSIGDQATGYEHYINYQYLADGKFLDSTAPESLVYEVDGDKRTIVSAMYIAEPEYEFGSQKLDDVLGPLASWHVHDNLCWSATDDGPKVVGTNDGGSCPEGSFLAGGDRAMVHVWITAHQCGPFAALEGVGAGQAADAKRVDQCAHDHGAGGHGADGHAAGQGHSGHAPATPNWPRPWDPAKPIDLSGVAGVSAEQERFATQLIEDSLRDLPEYADIDDAYADGYRSINDDGTGYEHLIKWELTSDGAMLDSTKPEALVYEVDGDQRTLVSAMYIAEPEFELGTPTLDQLLGPLASWHVHDDLCFVEGPEGGWEVAGLTDADGACAPDQTKLPNQPMVHVWIAPHECGPFAALEGVGAGQAADEASRVDRCAAGHEGH